MQVRDYAKDLVREHPQIEFRRWVTDTGFLVDFYLRQALERSTTPRDREDAFYALGRATMALDLGFRGATERELQRLKELH